MKGTGACFFTGSDGVIIQKRYKFYAAHRNELLEGSKCERLHGHRYGVAVNFRVERDPSSPAVTTLFEDLDKHVDRLIVRLDHRTLVARTDSVLFAGMIAAGLNYVPMPFPSSVENLAFFMFHCLWGSPAFIDSLEISETDSSTVTYTYDDYLIDLDLYGKKVTDEIDDWWQTDSTGA